MARDLSTKRKIEQLSRGELDDLKEGGMDEEDDDTVEDAYEDENEEEEDEESSSDDSQQSDDVDSLGNNIKTF